MKRGRDLIMEINAAIVPPGRCILWWLGQHGYIVKFGRTVVYIDAFLSPVPGRQIPPLLSPGDITNADLVLGSHDHADHIDRPAWPGIAAASPRALFVVPALLRDSVARDLNLGDRVLGVDDGISIEHAGIRITGIPAAHEFLDPDPATGRHPCVGFMVEGNGFTLYHAGDTCIYEGLLAKLRRRTIDAMLLPINGRDAQRLARGCIGNMTYQEAADLAGAIRPRVTIPAHYEMFAQNSEDPVRFVDYMRVKYPGMDVRRLDHGVPVCLPDDAATA